VGSTPAVHLHYLGSYMKIQIETNKHVMANAMSIGLATILLTIIISNFTSEPGYAVIISLIYMLPGLVLQDSNKDLINKSVEDGTYKNVQANTFFHPESLNKSFKLSFLRRWYFNLAWPHFLFVIFRAKNKS
jgi:hypothetical protein